MPNFLTPDETKTIVKMRRIMCVPQAMRKVLDENDDVRRHVRLKGNLSWPPPQRPTPEQLQSQNALELRVFQHEFCSARLCDSCYARNCWAAWSHAIALSAAGVSPRANDMEKEHNNMLAGALQEPRTLPRQGVCHHEKSLLQVVAKFTYQHRVGQHQFS